MLTLKGLWNSSSLLFLIEPRDIVAGVLEASSEKA